MMLVTILTVSYNSEKTIARTIESVLSQTYENIEYIIIDGASTDKTVEIAKSYEEAFDRKPGMSMTIVSESDSGMYDALNKGAKLAHGELVGQINSDDRYLPDAVESMVRLYEPNQYDAAWGSLLVKKQTGDFVKKAKIGKIWTTSGWCHPALFSKREVLLEQPYPLNNMYDDFYYITALYRAGKKLITTDKVIAEFYFGGMSTRGSLRDAVKRAGMAYDVYRTFGMSKLYYLQRLMIEIAKIVMN